LVTTEVYSGDFSVNPMIIESDLNPRDKKEFKFSIIPKETMDMKLSLMETHQGLDGYMTFLDVDKKNRFNPYKFIKLNKTNIKVKKGVPFEVTGIMSLPRNFKGKKYLALIVEEDVSKKKQEGVIIQVRFALNIKIQAKSKYRKYLRPNAKFNGIKISNAKNMKVEGLIVNKSDFEFFAYSKVTIRNHKNKLIKKFEIKSKSAKKTGDRTRLFPKAIVRVSGESNKLKNGIYKLQFHHKLGDRRSLIKNVKIGVEDEKVVFL